MHVFFKGYFNSSLRQFSVLYSSKILSLLIGLATISIWTRFFPVETYATYQLYLSFLELLSVVNLSGLDAVATQAGAMKQDGNFMAVSGVRVCTSLLIGILWVSVILYKKLWYGTLLLAVPIVVVIMLNQTYSLSENYLVGKGRIIVISMRDVVSKGTGLVVLAVCGIFAVSEPTLLFFIVLISALTFKGTIMINAYRGLQLMPIQWDRIKFGLQLSASEILAIGVTALQKPLVNEYGSLRDVALFSIALTFYNQLKMVILSVIPVMYPKLTKLESIKEAWQFFGSKIILFSVFFLLLCGIFFFCAPFIIPLIISRKYDPAIPYAQWLILLSGFSAVPALLRSLLSAQRKMRSIYIYDISYPFFLLGLIALLLPHFGVWGMVAARGGSIVLGTVLIIVLVFVEIRKSSLPIK